MRYRCTETFYLDKIDDKGVTLEGEQIIIFKDSIWHEPLENKDYRFIGGEVRLESINGWIEITEENLERYFTIKE